jgi:hypothetical protein
MMEDNEEEEDDDNYHPMYPEHGDTATGEAEDEEATDDVPADDLRRSLLMHRENARVKTRS